MPPWQGLCTQGTPLPDPAPLVSAMNAEQIWTLCVLEKRCERLLSDSRLPGPGGAITFYVIETFKLRSELKLQMAVVGVLSDGGFE